MPGWMKHKLESRLPGETSITSPLWEHPYGRKRKGTKEPIDKGGRGEWKKKESLRNHPSWLQIILQSYSHQDSMVLVQKQKYRPMEQDRKPRNKPMHLWVSYFWQTRQEYTMGQRQPLQWMVLENWTATCKRMKLKHFLTPHTKINSKWIKDLHVRPKTIKLLEENTGRTLDDINQSKIFYDPPPRVMEIKTK